MSATNRGATRKDFDFYETPEWLTRAIIAYLPESPAMILEPACGSGAITRVLRKQFTAAYIEGIEIDPKHGLGSVDFLKAKLRPEFDLIITNPPYAQALEFIQTAFKWRRNATSVVCMLLRLNFLGGQERAGWLRANMPSVYTSPRRPSFTGNGTDATEYAWFVWDGQPPTIQILETEKQDRTLPLWAGR